MPKDGSLTREHLLDTAERLIIDKGFAATSVDEVIVAAGSSKGAFFHHFPSKRLLADALVARYAAADIAHLRRALDAVATVEDAVQKVDRFLAMFEAEADDLMSAQPSCLYVATLTERQLVETGTSEPIRTAVLAWRDGFATLLRAARPAGATWDCDAWADQLFVTFEGSFILCRAMQDDSHMRIQLAAYRRATSALLGDKAVHRA